MALAKVRVHRQGPNTPAHFDTFEVDVQPAQTVLEILHAILYDVDPTLAFRRSCRSAICGSCAMRINGRSRLACNTQAQELIARDGGLTVEPLKNAPVLRDLAVDMRDFWRSFRQVRPSLAEDGHPPPEKGYVMPNDAFAPLKIVADCIFCASCVSECTVRAVNPDYLGPAALAKAYRFVGDPRDHATRKRLEAYSEKDGIWECDTCLYCNEGCPKGVKPLDAILRMREAAVEHGIVDNVGARHALAFSHSVMKGGRLNETTTAIKSLGIGGFLRPGSGNVGMTVRMAVKGKRPEVRKKPIEGMDEVRVLTEAVHREKKRRQGA